MSLYYDLESMAMRCKHGDQPPEPSEVRTMCRRAQVAVEMLGEVRGALEWMAFRVPDGMRLRMTIDTEDPTGWLARLVEVVDGASGVAETWVYPDDIDPEPHEVLSVGWLVTPTRRPGHLTVAGSYIPKTGLLGNVDLIPIGMVRVMSHLTARQVLPVEPSPT